MKTRLKNSVPQPEAANPSVSSVDDVSFADDELSQLELLVARRADELARLSGSQLNRSLEYWLQAEGEMRRERFNRHTLHCLQPEGLRSLQYLQEWLSRLGPFQSRCDFLPIVRQACELGSDRIFGGKPISCRLHFRRLSKAQTGWAYSGRSGFFRHGSTRPGQGSGRRPIRTSGRRKGQGYCGIPTKLGKELLIN